MLGSLRYSHQPKIGCVIPVERTLEKGKWDEAGSRQTEPADTDLGLTPVEGEMDGTRIEEVESQNGTVLRHLGLADVKSLSKVRRDS